MQTEPKPIPAPAKVPKWVKFALPVALALIAYSMMAPQGSIRTYDEFSDVTKEVSSLSEKELQKWNQGETLSPAEIERLKKASPLADTLVGYAPNAFKPLFLSGQIHYVIGNTKKALERLQDAISVAKGKDDQETVLAVAHACYLSSLCYFDLHDYEKASIQGRNAFQLAPFSADYAAAIASAELQRGDMKQATRYVKAALALNPNHKRAKQIASLLGS